MARTRSDDDLLEDLPPLDDGEEEDDRATDDEEEDLDTSVDEDGSDDEVASDLAVGDMLDPIRDEGGLDAEDARDLDVGTTELVEDLTQSRDDDDMAGVPGEDLSVGVDDVPDEGAEDLEGESPMQEGDEIDESALPAIDADDDGQEGIEQESIELPDEVPLPAWSPMRWEQVPLPLVAEPMKAVTVRGARVFSVGQVLIELQTDAAGGQRAVSCPSPSLPSVPTGLALADEGPPVVSYDGPELINNLGAFGGSRSLLAKLSAEGALALSRDRGRTWLPVPKQDEVAGFCVDDRGTLVAAVAAGRARVLLRSADGLGWMMNKSPAEHPHGWSRPALVASRGRSIAVATLDGAIDLSIDEGASWAAHAVPRSLTSIAFIPGPAGDLLLGTLFLESEDKSYLFSVEPDGTIELVADLSPAVGVGSNDEEDDSEGLGRAESMAWDEARGWLWIAGRFGLQAWRPALTA